MVHGDHRDAVLRAEAPGLEDPHPEAQAEPGADGDGDGGELRRPHAGGGEGAGDHAGDGLLVGAAGEVRDDAAPRLVERPLRKEVAARD